MALLRGDATCPEAAGHVKEIGGGGFSGGGRAASDRCGAVLGDGLWGFD